MNIVTLDLDKIDDSDRLRPVDEAWVKVLAESIKEEGQLQPIEVRPLGKNGRHKLTIGAHRVSAMRYLGLKTIEAEIVDVSEDRALLREIDENLCRHDLNDLDRAIFLGRRKAIYEKLHPQTRHGKSKEKQGVADVATSDVLRFTLDAARTMKMAERTIQRLVHRYEHLAPSVRERLKGTWLATMGSELDALARLPEHEQVAVVEMLLREEDPQPNVAAAKIAVRGITKKPRTSADEECSRLIALWRKTSAEGRRQFREFLATPASRKTGVAGE